MCCSPWGHKESDTTDRHNSKTWAVRLHSRCSEIVLLPCAKCQLHWDHKPTHRLPCQPGPSGGLLPYLPSMANQGPVTGCSRRPSSRGLVLCHTHTLPRKTFSFLFIYIFTFSFFILGNFRHKSRENGTMNPVYPFHGFSNSAELA